MIKAMRKDYCISIHAPHARSDERLVAEGKTEFQFQSTLLMRGATAERADPPFREHISIHAPHARSDCVNFRH